MTLHSHARHDCPTCRARGTVQRRSGGWVAALAAAYVTFAAMIFMAGLLGPTIIGVLPILAAVGLGLLPYLHGRVATPPTCSACGRYVPERATAPTVARRAAAATTAAHAA